MARIIHRVEVNDVSAGCQVTGELNVSGDRDGVVAKSLAELIEKAIQRVIDEYDEGYQAGLRAE